MPITNSALNTSVKLLDERYLIWIAAIANVLASSGFAGFLQGYILPDQGFERGQWDAGNSLYVVYAIGAMAVGFTLILCVQRPFFLKRGFWLFAAALLPYASILWSPDYYATFRNATFLACSIFPALATAFYFSPKAVIQIIMRMTTIILLSSLAVIILVPTYGVHTAVQIGNEGVHAGAWRGIFLHKSTFGEAVGLGMIVLIMSQRIWLPARLGMLGLTVVSLVFSESASPIVFSLCALITAAFISPRCFSGTVTKIIRSVSVLSFFGICIILLDDQNLNLILELLGRDASLTGRVPAWYHVLDYLNDLNGPLIVGFGYITGYDEVVFPAVSDVVDASFFYHIHNGFLDTYIGLGLVGISFFLLLTLSALHNAVSFLKSSNPDLRDLGRVATPVILYYLLSNLTTAAFFRGKNPIFCMSFLLIAAVIVHRPWRRSVRPGIGSVTRSMIK